ncbi:RNA binding effector protein Scp160 [Pseudomassariella vexata]|uniref:RNA binding effector protein Scp160 n=1 Tax=Pseudomassariella vexata TaxID=1141098 RepID=A0A1Y2DPX8_9PEZI|nr:RNA binding effector protein Scp160 [Pseudomassariella vexata]ORY61353.1 RNA binding effector protein Scp160 [Pseudomassariella vexata]
MAASEAESSAAERLLQKHTENHQPTVEDVPDEELKPTAKAKGLNMESEEAFPGLGGSSSSSSKGKAPVNNIPIWGAKLNGKSNGTTPANGTPGTSTPVSHTSTPAPGNAPTPNVFIPGRYVESIELDPNDIMPRAQLKRPIADIVKDLNRKSRAVLTISTKDRGKLKIEAQGPQDPAQQALRDLVAQIGAKQVITIQIPKSARAHIIGRQGATIKSIQEKSGARITLPKDDGQSPVDDDDDSLINITIEGNTIAAASAEDSIRKIVNSRSANVATKLRNIPAEFYPFIAGPNNSRVNALESDHGVQIRVPPHQPWSHSVPEVPASGERPLFAPANYENHIQLAGDRAAAAAARAEIDRRVRELQNQLQMDQCEIPRGRHQFIVGDRGMPMDDFFADTNCVIILPREEGIETVTVIGLEDDVNRGLEKAMDLAMNLNTANFHVARNHKHVSGGAPTYCRDVSRYLRQRKEIERLEQHHHVHINTPFMEGIESPWELYARDGKNLLKAQKEVQSIIGGHPPSRLASVPVDPFFHAYLRSDVKPRLQSDYGVHLVVPEAAEAQLPVILVYEGQSGPDEDYQIPQKAPNAEELRAFQQGLDGARTHILDLINKQEQIKTETLDVPAKYHEKLRRFIKKEQDITTRTAGGIPVRVSVKGITVTMRGPASAVASLAEKARAFVQQEQEDDKERGFTLSFEFPQKFANHLIGKGGSHIKELRDKFDVEIQVDKGMVELKGPKAKAEKAKAHILSLSRTWADETTHTLKIEPKYHRELIGAQGGQIGRLQNRYGVHINFPRSARPAKEDESAAADAASEAGKPRRQQGPDEVVIRGSKKGADEARDEIFSLYQYLKDNSFTANVSVQQKQLPSLIGSGGSGMDELRQVTGAKIDIPNERNEAEDAIVDIQIKGTKSQVAAAKKIIEEKKAVFEDTVVKTIDVDRKWHKILIGPQGSTLRDIIIKAGGPEDRRLQARCIQFPKQDTDGNAITVEGRQDVVSKIIASIEAAVSERASQVTETIEVSTEKHRTLIGRGGDAKRKLEAEFNVSIDIPRQGSGQTGVKLVGKPADVEKAKDHISTLIKEQQGETVQVPRKLHNAISDNGQFFRKLRNDHKVTVDHAGQPTPPKSKPVSTRAGNNGAMPLITDDPEQAADAHSWNIVDNISTEEGDIPWVLRGSPENIERAKKAISAALEQAQRSNSTGYLVLPDPSTYRYVIGQGGSKVTSIRKQSGCKITVPRDQNGDAIEINGSREGCEKAKDLILEAVRDGLASRQRD